MDNAQQPIKIRISKLENLDQLDKEIDALTVLYQECFNCAPNFDGYNKSEIYKIFKNYLHDGLVLLAHDISSGDEKLVGYVARVRPRGYSDDLESVFKKHIIRFNYKNTYIAAGVGVAKFYRGLGLAGLLMDEARRQIRVRYVLMDTQQDNIPSLISHQKSGYKMLEDIKPVTRRKRVNGTSLNLTYVFLVQDNGMFPWLNQKSDLPRVFDLIPKSKQMLTTPHNPEQANCL